MCFPVKIPSIY